MRWQLLVFGGVALVCVGGFIPPWLIANLLPRPAVGPTVPGPEAADLLPRLTGSLCTNADGAVRAIRLPDFTESELAFPSPETGTVFPSIHTVSEMARSGDVAFVENRMGTPSSSHALMLLEAGKAPRTLFTRAGDALWDHSIGTHLALTSAGDRVAYVRGSVGRQFPSAYLMEGSLEILDTKTGKVEPTGIKALDEGLCWFPDGKHLAFVAAVPAADAPRQPAGEDGFASSFAGWDPLPTVQVLDTRTGKVRMLHVGWRPRVATDGKRALVEDMATTDGTAYVSRLRLVDLDTGSSRAATLPGRVGEVLAFWPDDLALYWALPTAGTKLRNTRNNSPLVGPKLELTIKAGVLNTNRFQTVVPYIDPRTKATWGSGMGFESGVSRRRNTPIRPE